MLLVGGGGGHGSETRRKSSIESSRKGDVMCVCVATQLYDG